jgi:hypothetical protein
LFLSAIIFLVTLAFAAWPGGRSEHALMANVNAAIETSADCIAKNFRQEISIYAEFDK